MIETNSCQRREITVRGIVQGVGFRPFVYSLAHGHGLSGLVRNDADGVHIEVQGPESHVDDFIAALELQAPPLAVIDSIVTVQVPLRQDAGFSIEASRGGMKQTALISPDVATCEACRLELFDPANRRYRYPFINCTSCGPRFTITRSVPYDRPATTMTGFVMCAECRQEYDDPRNRRFHAQPNACPRCGPSVRLLDCRGLAVTDAEHDAIAGAAALLRGGAIVAVKGLGGYHLACDPFNQEAVRALRNRKVRQDKPFALMAADLTQARSLCRVDQAEADLLESLARPVVLLRRAGAAIAGEVAPRQTRLGIMLAYTPLHHLLLSDIGTPLVMTSGNRSDEPIAFQDGEALSRLGDIADYFLVHDRPIHVRCDDSVVRVDRDRVSPLRRSRGYAPAPLRVKPVFRRHTLACGGELKSTFCLGRDGHAILSHHIGDLENYETLRSFRAGIEHYSRTFDIRPELVIHDFHPEYLSTKYAQEMAENGLRAIGVQHHHAHIAACLADNGVAAEERVIGVALDGIGYGLDGAMWGGEFLTGSIEDGFDRRGHLAYVPLPGGVAAIRQPWRMAIAHLLSVYTVDEVLALDLRFLRAVGEPAVRQVAGLIEHGLNTPLTSSAGRLFDAVAALVGVPGADRITYEGQAAIELELVAGSGRNRPYPFVLSDRDEPWTVNTRSLIAAIVGDVRGGESVPMISARFHRTIAAMILTGCERIREESGNETVALSGGTFQNALLLDMILTLLEEKNFTVYRHHQVPANDGGLSLGQAVLGNSQERRNSCV